MKEFSLGGVLMFALFFLAGMSPTRGQETLLFPVVTAGDLTNSVSFLSTFSFMNVSATTATVDLRVFTGDGILLTRSKDLTIEEGAIRLVSLNPSEFLNGWAIAELSLSADKIISSIELSQVRDLNVVSQVLLDGATASERSRGLARVDLYCGSQVPFQSTAYSIVNPSSSEVAEVELRYSTASQSLSIPPMSRMSFFVHELFPDSFFSPDICGTFPPFSHVGQLVVSSSLPVGIGGLRVDLAMLRFSRTPVALEPRDESPGGDTLFPIPSRRRIVSHDDATPWD